MSSCRSATHETAWNEILKIWNLIGKREILIEKNGSREPRSKFKRINIHFNTRIKAKNQEGREGSGNTSRRILFSLIPFHRAKTTPLLQDGVQPATSTEILRKGGRKIWWINERNKWSGWRPVETIAIFAEIRVGRMCEARYLSRRGEGRKGEGLMEGRMRRKAAARRMLERRVSTRFSSEILLEQHFSALHSYFGSKSSGLIKMGRGLYTPRALEPPSTRPRRNIKMARLDWMKYVSVMMILADLYRFCSVTCQNFYLLLLLFLLLLFFQV